MKNYYLLLMILLNFGPAHAASSDLCKEAVEALARAQQIPFQFETGTNKMKDAVIVDSKSNPRVYRNQKNKANGKNNENRVTLEVFEKDGQPEKYSLQRETDCENHCTRSVLTFQLSHEGGQCHIQRAQVGDYLENGDLFKERTLWTKEICQSFKDSKTLTKFSETHPDWKKQFSIQGSKKNLIGMVHENCRKFGDFSNPLTPVGSIPGTSPTGSAK